MTRVVSSSSSASRSASSAARSRGRPWRGAGRSDLGSLSGSAQAAEGDGVAAGLGGEVPAEAEHVRPFARAARTESSPVSLRRCLRHGVARSADGGAEPPRDALCRSLGVVGGLGGVLGQVAGDLLRGQRLVGVVGAAAGADRLGRRAGARTPAPVPGRPESTPGTVSRTAAAACVDQRGQRGRRRPSGAGAKPSGVLGPSRRTRAWKWIRPRSWYSATLAYWTVATSASRVAGTRRGSWRPAGAARW